MWRGTEGMSHYANDNVLDSVDVNELLAGWLEGGGREIIGGRRDCWRKTRLLEEDEIVGGSLKPRLLEEVSKVSNPCHQWHPLA
jgi:hypothetical protein